MSCPYCRFNREQNEELREQVRQLKADMAPLNILGHLKKYLGLTDSEARLVSALSSGDYKTTEVLSRALYYDKDPKEPETIRVLICYTRKKLEQLGLNIENHTGLGYFITKQDLDKMLRVISERKAQQ